MQIILNRIANAETPLSGTVLSISGVAAPFAVTAVIRFLHEMSRDLGEVCVAICLFSGWDHQIRELTIRPFEQIERQAALRIMMLEREDQRFAPLKCSPGMHRCYQRAERLVVRLQSSLRFRFRLQGEVVRQTEAVTVLDPFDFMLTICKEGRITSLFAGGGSSEGEFPLLPRMPHNQSSPLEFIREHNDQAGDHAVQLFAVAMGDEEAPFFVDQELVECGLQLVHGQAQGDGDCSGQFVYCRLPSGAQTEPSGIEFKRFPHFRVNKRFRPLAEGGDVAVRDQLFGQPPFQRKIDDAQSLDLQSGIGQFQLSAGTESGGFDGLSDCLR